MVSSLIGQPTPCPRPLPRPWASESSKNREATEGDKEKLDGEEAEQWDNKYIEAVHGR